MFSPLKNQRGFTLIELVIIIILIGVLAAVAVPRYVDLRENAVMASAQATLDAGRAAIMLDFADQVLDGGYTDLFPTATLDGEEITDATDIARLEAELQTNPSYPPNGPYNTPNAHPGQGFRWWQVREAVTTGQLAPPEIDGIIDLSCTGAAEHEGGTDDENCWVSRL